MSSIERLVVEATRHARLSRRALARRAQLAPETVSRICRRGTGDYGTVEKLVASAGLRLCAVPIGKDAGRLVSEPTSDHARLDARSLALHAVIAGKVLANPSLIGSKILPTIQRFKRAHGRGGAVRLLEDWERAARSGPSELVRLCVDPSERGKQLRQASPLTGILLPGERREIYEAFAA